ncbi:hypothetical protein OQY15_15965 [Pedobacter sp. MC2016-15]|uniref:hypothetical protein n=1 Tax=Pedobacter sp. MC2016-15 TaxID=2994473 RepID=UPI002248728F|nr:hypothetical protein [Pedobacter sp. MC2016-15]MCX2480601.1 hypothetical protein [Pedobacter sp. MC2016-15]
MLTTLTIIACGFFLAHLVLLLSSFPKFQLAPIRYFYSHLTLWITGIIVFAMAVSYSGDGQSSFLDYFDSTFKRAMILVFTVVLSTLAHFVVKLLIVPALRKMR